MKFISNPFEKKTFGENEIYFKIGIEKLYRMYY